MIQMPAGSSLVFYSDGIYEAPGPAAQEYGVHRILDQASSPAATARSIVEDARGFSGGRAAADDMSVVLIRVPA